MAEQFLTLMADLDIDTQNTMSEWYNILKKAGFTGIQTPGLPFHISLATFPLEQESKAIELAEKVAGEFSPIQVHISHIGIFAPGRVLFGGPERSPGLEALHDACEMNPNPQGVWTPHVTMLIDEPATICNALPLFLNSFRPLNGKITQLHLCAFWPTREIVTVELTGKMADYEKCFS